MRLLPAVGGLLAMLGSGAAARTFTNPLQATGPDPWVIRHGGDYHYTNTMGHSLTRWKSKTLAGVQAALVLSGE